MYLLPELGSAVLLALQRTHEEEGLGAVARTANMGLSKSKRHGHILLEARGGVPVFES